MSVDENLEPQYKRDMFGTLKEYLNTKLPEEEHTKAPPKNELPYGGYTGRDDYKQTLFWAV